MCNNEIICNVDYDDSVTHKSNIQIKQHSE